MIMDSKSGILILTCSLYCILDDAASTPGEPVASSNTSQLIIDGFCSLPDCSQYHTSSHPFDSHHPTRRCLLRNPKSLPIILYGAAGWWVHPYKVMPAG